MTMPKQKRSFEEKLPLILAFVLPILIMYPFFQKYFVKGITLGAVKE